MIVESGGKMKAKLSRGLTGVALIALALCAFADNKPREKKKAGSELSSGQSNASATMPAIELSVIGFLEKRDQTITIKAGSHGAVYSIKSAESKMLFENLTADELRAQAPEIHELIKNAVAAGSGKGSQFMDARVMR